MKYGEVIDKASRGKNIFWGKPEILQRGDRGVGSTIFVFSCKFVLPSPESDQNTITSSLRSYQPSFYHSKMRESR